MESFCKLYDGIELVDGTTFKAAVADIRGDWKGLMETWCESDLMLPLIYIYIFFLNLFVIPESSLGQSWKRVPLDYPNAIHSPAK